MRHDSNNFATHGGLNNQWVQDKIQTFRSRKILLQTDKKIANTIEFSYNFLLNQFSRVSTSVSLPTPESVVIVSLELASMPAFCKSITLKIHNVKSQVNTSLNHQGDWVHELRSLTAQLDSKFDSLHKASIPFFLSRHLKLLQLIFQIQ